jgi:hypothetical protein
MENPNRHSFEKLSDTTKKEVAAMAKKLREEGYEFTLEETSDEYIIEHEGRAYHFEKLEQFPTVDEKGSTRFTHLAHAMEEQIRKEIEKNK